MMRLPCYITVLALCTSCIVFNISRDEVARITSPSGRIDAVLLEVNGGATTSFGYEVYLSTSKGTVDSRVKVAYLYGAVRNDNAYGVNLKWEEPQKLVIEYLEARSVELLQGTPTIGDKQIRMVLRHGINDPNAPAGGMLHNLKERK